MRPDRLTILVDQIVQGFACGIAMIIGAAASDDLDQNRGPVKVKVVALTTRYGSDQWRLMRQRLLPLFA